MKFIAKNISFQQDVDIKNTPSIIYDEVAVPTTDGDIAYVLGPCKWNRLETDTDLTNLIGQWFNLISADWQIDECIVTSDNTIFFRNAKNLK